MPDRWIIRVLGKEYGPVDFETLQEWKKEGRLIPQNPARGADVDLWTTAADIPGLFNLTPVVSVTERSTQPPVQLSRHSFGRIVGQTFRVYWKSWFKFFGLALLVILPSACGQLASLWIETTPSLNVDLRSVVAGGFAFCMLIISIVLWPVYIAGTQILSAETLAGRRIGFFTALNEAVKFWPRVAVLCVFVYGVFFLLALFALAIAAMILASASSPFMIFFALVLLAIQVWLFGHFFINVLFWQQFAVLENAGVIESLRESKNLARSGRELHWYQRPFWCGGVIVSLWLAFVIAIIVVPQWSTMLEYFNQMLSIQDSQALLQKLNAAEQARHFDGLSFGLGILQRILQPLLGIAFVTLYFDCKRNNNGKSGI